ncbi:MAG: M20/M25/M40 family metallo-hydrolase [Spirochaetaceae bacterium]|nr:M20/M25/M40 family metallo-hydrolase [Spirochaetaceae bacterium]
MPSSERATGQADLTDRLDIDELAAWVAIPSVSRDADAATMRAAADWLASRLSPLRGRVEATGGHPVVRAEWLGAPDAPTVLVYGHYDVQPTGAESEWSTPPFQLTVDGDVLRGRGVSDDKGPVYLVVTLLLALLDRDGRLPLNVKLLVEGEEEIGSPHLPDYLRAHATELAADLVISADGAMWRPSEPSLSTASKGLATFSVVVTGADADLHSGRYGGTVANPAHALVELLAGLHDPEGSVAVAGFYDGMAPLPELRRAAIAEVGFDDDAYARELGLPAVFGEPGFTTLERLWERPTLEINGIEAGGKYTVIPHRATGHVSCRLVPGQDPDRVLQAISDHLAGRVPTGVNVEVVLDEARVPAYTIPADHPAIRAATAALEDVYPGEPVLLAVIGGTLPATVLFEEVLGAKTLFFSFSTADERLHAPDEFMRTRRLAEGMRAWEQLWRLLADGPHRLAPRAEVSVT